MNTRRLSGLLKELKRIFRRRRKLGLSFIFLIVAAGTAILALNTHEEEQTAQNSAERLREQAIAAWAASDSTGKARTELISYLQEHEVEQSVEVYRIYVCGEEKQSYGKLTSKQILELLEQHPNWQVDEYGSNYSTSSGNEYDAKSGNESEAASMSSSSEEVIIFYEYIEDLSERCKQSAYIGLDAMDHLTLFEGSPAEEQVIRTFFQIDIEHLKSSLPEEAIESLYNGIRIRDYAQYNSVISTFSQYAVEKSERDQTVETEGFEAEAAEAEASDNMKITQ
ncbi:hypothetical protein PRECH8_21800 [Insulibacter thermoxylanivorax]|uniref:Bypass of forespore C C-terminal domain-containing protein n=1 Tax=Insulibacter thermoxylanivorax TaxID=2749268 RepID=A0A916VGM8_9BACL|nr:BofC C-terminal domain-containing protein [Insulibacter thermoxylanivorax]GFR38884.1 hypothetical protein PRECH8_21800 [Insulibacter thermoxylanivorax]